MDPEQQRLFLDAIARGQSVSKAVEEAGVDRKVPYRFAAKRAGRPFRTAWITARRRHLDAELVRAQRDERRAAGG